MSSVSNAADYLLEQGTDGDVAVVEGDRRHTYAQLRAACGALAAELAALGLQPGARVGVLGTNSLLWIAAYLASMKLDLVAVPFFDKLTEADVARNARLVRLDAVVADRLAARRFASVFDAASDAEVPVLTDEALATQRAPHWPESATDPDRDAVLMFTSGTTATPRAVRVTHRNIRANTDSIVDYLGLRADDRALVILPFSYCYGASVLHTHLRVGARLVLCNSFVYPETAIDLLDREACTVLAGVPSSYQLLLRASSFASRLLPSLRLLQQAGGKLSPVLIEELRAAQPGAEVFVMYGATEATARLSYLPPERLDDKLGSVGRGIPGVELRVLDEEGRPVPPGERGEIYARGDSISPGYLDDPAATAAKFTAHGLRTGDVAVVDDDGFIFIVDRTDDFIKSWGHRISSQEVEACALGLEALVSAAAVGVPDDQAGEAVVLFATLRPGADLGTEDILAFLRARLPKHMVPASVVVLDALPLTVNGKTAKASLREMASGARTMGQGVG